MKIQRTFTIDLEVWAEAKRLYPNVSSKVESLLREANGQGETPTTKEELKKALERQESILSAYKSKLTSFEKKESENKKNDFTIEGGVGE